MTDDSCTAMASENVTSGGVADLTSIDWTPAAKPVAERQPPHDDSPVRGGVGALANLGGVADDFHDGLDRKARGVGDADAQVSRRGRRKLRQGQQGEHERHGPIG